MILAFAALFSMLYLSAAASRAVHDPNVIPVEPKISQLQAIETAERHIRAEVKDLREIRLNFQMYNFSASEYNSVNSPGWNEYVQYRQNMRNSWDLEHVKQYPELLNLRLYFVHANGTTYAINGTDHTFVKVCDQPSPACPINRIAVNAARDRLVYYTDMMWLRQSREMPNDVGDIVIDAETGEIVWSSIEYAKNTKPMPNINFDNRTISQLFRELANPPETTNIAIQYGASIQSSGDGYLPKEVFVTLGVNNRVVWTNQDSVPSSVISDSGYVDRLTGKKLDSGPISPESKFEFVFTEPGAYPYHSEPHPWMRGTIFVVENFS